MRKSRVIMVILAVGLMLLSATALQARTEELDKTFSAKERVNVKTVSGDVIIKAGTGDQIDVHLVYRYRPSDSFEPLFKERDKALTISEDMHGNCSGRSEWTITVPPGTRLSISSASGDFTIDGMKNKINAETASGDITVTNCSGDIKVESASGDVMLTDVSGEIDAESASGDVTGERLSGFLTLESASGDVLAEKAEGAFDLSSASGNVEALDIVLNDDSEFETATGRVDVSLAKSPEHDLIVGTATGRAVLDFGGNPIKGHFEFTTRADRGRIDSPFDFDDVETYEKWDEEYVRKSFTRGGSTPSIYIETATGKIALKE